jgi:hypothetical protein
LTPEELEQRFPEIPWREPVAIRVGEIETWGCRVCIANVGLRAQDVVERKAAAFETRGEFLAHWQDEHEA